MSNAAPRGSALPVIIVMIVSLVLLMLGISALTSATAPVEPGTQPVIAQVEAEPFQVMDESGQRLGFGALRVFSTAQVQPGQSAYVQLTVDALDSGASALGPGSLTLQSLDFTGQTQFAASLLCQSAVFSECVQQVPLPPEGSASGRFDWTWALTPTAESASSPMEVRLYRLNGDDEPEVLYTARLTVTVGIPVNTGMIAVAIACAAGAVIVLIGGLYWARRRMTPEEKAAAA